jgi:hypothetical protein
MMVAVHDPMREESGWVDEGPQDEKRVGSTNGKEQRRAEKGQKSGSFQGTRLWNRAMDEFLTFCDARCNCLKRL